MVDESSATASLRDSNMRADSTEGSPPASRRGAAARTVSSRGRPATQRTWSIRRSSNGRPYRQARWLKPWLKTTAIATNPRKSTSSDLLWVAESRPYRSRP